VDTKLVYDGVDGDGLHGYTDSSLGDQTDDYHSTSGYVFILAGGAISWSSRKQRTVAQNTTEAKYMALSEASNQAFWYRSFMGELCFSVEDPVPLHCDNKGAVDLAVNLSQAAAQSTSQFDIMSFGNMSKEGTSPSSVPPRLKCWQMASLSHSQSHSHAPCL